MTGMQRLEAALCLGVGSRVPVIPQVFAFTAKLCGTPFMEYLTSGETLARCQLQAQAHYGYDAVFGVMDVSVETEAVGSKLCFRDNYYPSVASYAITQASDLKGLCLPDPSQAGRMPEILRALGIMRSALADQLPVVGLVLGPLTLATQLMGMEKALYLAIDEPDQFAEILDFASQVTALFGRAQLRAGAHLMMVFDPASTPAVVPPHFFREFELPLITRVFAEFKREGSLANWLHIAGPVEPILPYYGPAGADIANLDYQVDPDVALRQLPGICLNGNLKSSSFIFSSPEEIRDTSFALLGAFQDRGRFILSSGCEIPPESRPENVGALVSAVGVRGRLHG